jgi:hypothetical protein
MGKSPCAVKAVEVIARIPATIHPSTKTTKF